MMGRRSIGIALTCLALITLLPWTILAERLPARRYTTADGLSSDYIVSIYRDSRGFLWFSTRDGLSRFDGTRFTNYGVADGLPGATVNRVLETRAGAHWIGTNGGGVYRFNPTGRRPTATELARTSGPVEQGDPDLLFVRYPVSDLAGANRVNVLAEDRTGTIWVGTDVGLFAMTQDGGAVRFRELPLPRRPADASFRGVHTIVEDDGGNLWIGGGWGLTRRLPDGRLVAYPMEGAGARDRVNALLVDRQQRLWLGTGDGARVLAIDSAATFAGAGPLERLIPRSAAALPPAPDTNGGVARQVMHYSTANGLASDNVGALYQDAEGRTWVGTAAGVTSVDGDRLRTYDITNGLSGNLITTLSDDAAGNVWVGTVSGATRLIRHGLISYDETDGLRESRVHSLRQDRDGQLVVLSGDYLVSTFDGHRFASVRPGIPANVTCAWMSPCGYLDRAGSWWMLTTTGLYRVAAAPRLTDLAGRPPTVVDPSGQRIGAGNVYNLFEDRHGDVWIDAVSGGLVRWTPASDEWRAFGAGDGLPATRSLASAFGEDATGALWVGFYDGGLARFRDGRFRTFTVADGAPPGLVTALHTDAAGRLWIGTSQAGLTRVDNPAAETPAFVPLAPSRGLNVRCLVEDRAGRIYAGTSRGVHRIDPGSGRVERFGMGEGLASDFVTAAMRDRHGTLWFGTISGLSRFDPADEPPPAAPPRVHISGLRVRGVAYPVSELGDTEVAPFTLGPDQNQLEIEFFGLAFNSAEPLRYQYRIDGIDREWNPMTDLRSVNYGRLPAGAYRFLVRSVRSDGVVSATPAAVSFVVLAPIYARWWFITLVTMLLSGAALLLYRARLAQLLRVERVRSRIATDLHDDIGASLSQIAILAEVAQRPPVDGAPATSPLARIAETSRGLVDSMSDIVWAINPEVDSLSDLVHRMRRFAEDTLSAEDIEVSFKAPDLRQDPRLGPQIRREIFLILKEAVTNIAKHASAGRVTIELDADRRQLRLRVTDDGRGFDPTAGTDGNGMANISRRAASLGGRVHIQSRPGRGTTIELEAPLQSAAGFLP